MSQKDAYILGRADAELMRLRRQIAELAPDSEAHLDRIGITPGQRVVDLGCGPGGVLELLNRRVGPEGAVLGVERSPRFAELARGFVVDRGLGQTEVIEADAYDTGLPRGSFDGAHMRLVLVNVPEPERMAREMVALVRPGGWVASFEADYMSHFCDPPHPAWDRLLAAHAARAEALGIDLHVGRRTHRMFAEAGVTDIQTDAVVHVYPHGHARRPILLDFVANARDELTEGGFATAEQLDADLSALERHLTDPGVLVVSHLFFRLSGRVPR